MGITSIFTLFLTILSVANGYKMVIFVPNLANSQIQFSARVAEVLANGGHDVTMLSVSFYSDFVSNVKIPKGVKTYTVDASAEGINHTYVEKRQAETLFTSPSLFDGKMMNLMKEFMSLLQQGCRKMIRNKEFLKWLKNEKFDIAYTYIYSSCPMGIVHHVKIPTWIWLNSGGLMDHVAGAVGVPIIPSYVPPMMMAAHDEMTFVERVKSFTGHIFMSQMRNRFSFAKETEIFREELNDPNFPDVMEIGAKCPLVVVNTNDLYDLPRPLLAKVVNIGGLGVGFDSAKPLTGEFKKITETGKGTIIFSFGSVAPAHEMPLEWKNALLSAFSEFPDYQFVLRYVKDDLNDRLPSNVHLFKWLPQKDILLHENTKAFITHGGYNSLQEAITAGIPLVTIALTGDQPKNSKIAQKHGFSVNIEKSTLSKETLVAGLTEVLTNSRYSTKAKRLSAMVRKQPIKPAELLLKWSEFLAEFKTLENLEPAGQKLNSFQYFSLDVISFLLFVIFFVLLIIFFLFRAIFRCFCRCFRSSNNYEKLKSN